MLVSPQLPQQVELNGRSWRKNVAAEVRLNFASTAMT